MSKATISPRFCSLLAVAMYAAFTRDAAAGRVAFLAVALTRYQLDHGIPPAKLADLVPAYIDALPTDPLYVAPFHYELDPEGYVVSSPWVSLPHEYRDSKTGTDTIVLYRWRIESPDESTPD